MSFRITVEDLKKAGACKEGLAWHISEATKQGHPAYTEYESEYEAARVRYEAAMGKGPYTMVFYAWLIRKKLIPHFADFQIPIGLRRTGPCADPTPIARF